MGGPIVAIGKEPPWVGHITLLQRNCVLCMARVAYVSKKRRADSCQRGSFSISQSSITRRTGSCTRVILITERKNHWSINFDEKLSC